MGIKMARNLKAIDLLDKAGAPFKFSIPDVVLQEAHQIDLGAGGQVELPEPITNPQTRDRYVVSSLIEEAITSSQLEGAATTREVAKQMLVTGREPRDLGERMIFNNYRTIEYIRTLTKTPLTPELVLDIHRHITENTLDDPSGCGRLRTAAEKRVVADSYGEVFHDPPNAGELEDRMISMCAFANKQTPDYFVHPAIRAIILHFWLAYDHPFVDGNGRTARALFYWSMLSSGYWLFEFISISTILRKAPVKYARSFLYTETDDNDLTYFLIAQAQVIRRAVVALQHYIAKKAAEVRQAQRHTRALYLFNHRQVDLISHALRHPGDRYTIAGHQHTHNVTYQTARTDLLNLEKRGLLVGRKLGKKMTFTTPVDLSDVLLKLE
ncbi:MAG TPA: Fic family protein [Polyangiaceae bacterium]